MALYVNKVERTYYIGGSKIDVESCNHLQADGDELERIIRNSVNLPHTKERVCVWTGDLAKIAARAFNA